MGKINFDKKLRSGNVTNGLHKSGNRAHLRAIGLLDEDIEKPFIGIANSYNAMHPGHMHLQELSQNVKEGIWAAGGVPLGFFATYFLNLNQCVNAHSSMAKAIPPAAILKAVCTLSTCATGGAAIS